MASHTIVNLRDVKDSAVDFGLSPGLEARFARSDLGCEQTGLSYQRLAPGAGHPFAHRHVSHEELYVVVGGAYVRHPSHGGAPAFREGLRAALEV